MQDKVVREWSRGSRKLSLIRSTGTWPYLFRWSPEAIPNIPADLYPSVGFRRERCERKSLPIIDFRVVIEDEEHKTIFHFHYDSNAYNSALALFNALFDYINDPLSITWSIEENYLTVEDEFYKRCLGSFNTVDAPEQQPQGEESITLETEDWKAKRIKELDIALQKANVHVEKLESEVKKLQIEKESFIREPIQWFAKQMERKLREHDDRGGWDDERLDWLFDRLIEEVEELRVEVNRSSELYIINEAADVANFCMMLADKVRE